MRTHFSVAIVGAGPTGLVLANLLGKAGVRTLLVDANPAAVGEPRAVSIDDESLRVVQALGLLDVVASEIVSGYGSEYLGPDGRRFLKVKPRAQPYGHPRRNAFRQPVLEAQLREGLARFPSIEVRFGCRAEGFIEHEAGVRLQLCNADGAANEVQADYLAGCDGSWSPTREALGYALAGSSLDERWLIIDLENSPSASPETIVYCDPRRPGIMLPGPRHTRRYEFKLMADETDAFILSDQMIAELLQTHDFPLGGRVIRKTVYHFHARIADHWGRGRVWLAGDAAHLMPPFAGQGMNSGIRDAANLGWKLAAIVSEKLGPGLLQTYETERRGHVADMIALALKMGTVFAPRTAWHSLAIRTAFRVLGVWPAARSYFAEMKYKPAPRHNGGFLLQSQLTRRGVVGRMLPQPTLPDRYGGVALDNLLGDGFALLGVGVDQDVVERLSLGPACDALVGTRLALPLADVPSLGQHHGQLLLVRPDRYVMARFTPAEAQAVTRKLDLLFAETWEPAPGDTGRGSTEPHLQGLDGFAQVKAASRPA